MKLHHNKIHNIHFVFTEIKFNQTTCSQDAFMRGPSQKIVGFSFYGDINTPKSKKKGINSKIFKVNG